MPASAYWVRFDTYPPLEFTVSDVNGAVSLANASAVKAIWQSTTIATQVTGYGVASVASAAGGFCVYGWGSSDLAFADTYSLQAKVMWNTGSQIETFPNNSYGSFVVFPDLDDHSY